MFLSMLYREANAPHAVSCQSPTFTIMRTVISSCQYKLNDFQISVCLEKQKENFGCGVVVVNVELEMEFPIQQREC